MRAAACSSTPHGLDHGLRVVVLLCALISASGLQCQAQVLEIGEGGQVSVYDGPAVFTAAGATPLPRPPRETPPARGGRLVDREAIADAASAAELSPSLVEAVAWQESRFVRRAVSPAGALGEMQLMPATARALGVDPLDSRQNYGGGAAYLHALMQRYHGDLERALAAYDAGPGAVDRYGGVPPFKETRAYVAAIMNRLSQQVLAVEANGTGR